MQYSAQQPFKVIQGHLFWYQSNFIHVSVCWSVTTLVLFCAVWETWQFQGCWKSKLFSTPSQ